MRRLLVALVAAASGCAWGKLAPGPTKHGLAFAVSAPSDAAARAEALDQAIGLFLPATSPARTDAAALARSKTDSLLGRERLKGGKGAVEVRVERLGGLLDKMVRPPGYSDGSQKVVLLLAEPDAGLGVGRAADALRRALTARGYAVVDGRDALERRIAGGTPAELVAGAMRSGADWVLVGRAGADALSDDGAGSGAWRGRGAIEGALHAASTGEEAAPIRVDSTAVDMSSAAARAKALELAGELAAEPAASAIAAASGGRTEGALLALGDVSPPSLRSLLDALRGLDGVEGAALRTLDGPDGSAVIRVFMRGFGTDELAARLLRVKPSILLMGIEPTDRRLTIELGGGRP